MNLARLIGSMRIIVASVPFLLTTFATCIASAFLLDFWHQCPWRSPYAYLGFVGFPAITFLSAISAFRIFGETGAFGPDPVADFRDCFRRIWIKHFLSCVAFLVPQVVVSADHSLSLFTLLICALFVINSLFPSMFVNQAIVERVQYDNRSKFIEGLGTSRRVKRTKGIRRK